MSDIMTRINLRKTEGYEGNGLAEWGRKTRGEMIATMRNHAQWNKRQAEAVLAAKDEDFIVKIVRGVHVQHLIKELLP